MSKTSDRCEESKRRLKSTRTDPSIDIPPAPSPRTRFEWAPLLSQCRCGVFTTQGPCSRCRDMDEEEFGYLNSIKNDKKLEGREAVYADTERLKTRFLKGETDLCDMLENYIPPPTKGDGEMEDD